MIALRGLHVIHRVLRMSDWLLMSGPDMLFESCACFLQEPSRVGSLILHHHTDESDSQGALTAESDRFLGSTRWE